MEKTREGYLGNKVPLPFTRGVMVRTCGTGMSSVWLTDAALSGGRRLASQVALGRCRKPR